MMPSTQYLPSEVIQYSNFPELYQLKDKISDFQKAIVPIMTAISEYDLGQTDCIYVNIAEVQRVRDMSFDITEVLGMAPNVCYDMLLNFRDAQEALNELIFSFQYEQIPVVVDKQRTAMKELNSVVNMTGDVI
jgi:hypothetical protein